MPRRVMSRLGGALVSVVVVVVMKPAGAHAVLGPWTRVSVIEEEATTLVGQSLTGQKEYPEEEEQQQQSTTTNDKTYTTYSATYVSQAFPLRPGEFVYTEDDETPLTFPTDVGPYAITGFSGEIVDAVTKRSTPLSEVYDHHWVVTHDPFANELCRDGPTYAFGIGAESRNTPVNFPAGYGFYVQDPSTYWGGNIHLLRTEYLAGDDAYKAAKECAECWYAEGKGCRPRQNGTFDCCGEDVHYDATDAYKRCPTALDAPLNDTKSYRLQYTINYTEIGNVDEAHVGVWTTPDCATYYQALAGEDDNSPEHLSSTEFHVPHDAEILLAIGHQHVGSLNISLFVNDEFVCASTPTYGTTEGVAGDELGYLVQMSHCFQKGEDPTRPTLELAKNDVVRLDSWYWVGQRDDRIAPFPAGTHLNVMGYLYTVYRLL